MPTRSSSARVKTKTSSRQKPSPPATSSRTIRTRRGQTSSNKFFVLAGLVLVILGVLFFLSAKLSNWHSYKDAHGQYQISQPVTVQGTLLFTALKPDPNDKGEVHLAIRRLGEQTWQDPHVTIPLQQHASWEWPTALPGENYQLQATLIIDGKEMKKSEIVTVSAPAEKVEIPLEVNWHDLPADVVRASTTELAGDVEINGVIPSGSVLEVYALAPQHYQSGYVAITPQVLQAATPLVVIAKPEAMTHWSWLQAIPLQKYVLVAVLKNGTQILGISEEIVEADASETQLQQTINSTAPASAEQQTSVPSSVLGVSTETPILAQLSGPAKNGLTSISGLVTLQGPKQKDTSLLMLWRKPGDTNFQVINRYMYPPAGGTAWRWDQAIAGQQYQITAALQVNDQNTSTLPNPITVTAPASNLKMSLNTWYVIPKTPTQPVNELCSDSNQVQSIATLRFPKIPDAGQYWVQVGTSQGGSDLYNQKLPMSDQDFKIKVQVPNNKQNYVRYSYASCVHCDSNTNFAPFSDEVGFTCN